MIAIPHAPEIEKSVLGSILFKPSILDDTYHILKVEYFYTDKNIAVYKAMLKLYETKKIVSLETVSNILDNQKFEDVGYVSELIEDISTYMDITQLIEILKDKYKMRLLIDLSHSLLGEVESSALSCHEIINMAEQKLLNISNDDNSKALYDQSEAVSLTMSSIEDRLIGNTNIIPSGIKTIDDCIQGFYSGEMTIIGARPSMGKSAFAINVARNMALAGYPVMIFSLEMSVEAIETRLISIETGVTLSELRSNVMSRSSMVKIGESLTKIVNMPIYINDMTNLTVNDIISIATQGIKKYGVKAIFVDYLQKIKNSGNKDLRIETAYKSSVLKDFAKNNKIPVIALAQLNRSGDSRADKRPIMGDLKESSDIEQDADVIAFLYREYIIDRNLDPKNCELIISKNREGITGMIELEFDGPISTFKSRSF